MRTGRSVKIFFISLISSVIALTLISGHSAAEGNTSKPALGVMLEVMASGQCIDNAGSRKHGAGLQGWKCSTRNLNQRFAVAWRGKSKRVAAIRNKLSSLCLDILRQSKKAGARIVQNRCGNFKSQNWEFRKSGAKDWFLIKARHSHLCLSLARNGKRDSYLILSKCNTRDATQKFKRRT